MPNKAHIGDLSPGFRFAQQGAIAGMLINLVITLVASRISPAPPELIQQIVERMRHPNGSGPTGTH